MTVKRFITDSSARSHMVNMTNLKDAETRVTVGDSIKLTGTNHGNWHGWQKCDGQLHCVTFKNTAIIPGLHENIFSVARALQKGFQVTSEGETLIIRKNPPIFVLTIK